MEGCSKDQIAVSPWNLLGPGEGIQIDLSYENVDFQFSLKIGKSYEEMKKMQMLIFCVMLWWRVQILLDEGHKVFAGVLTRFYS